MGVVYKAEDTKLERLVAIKFLPHHIAANGDERRRFKVEAKAAAALNHPNIATIHAIEEIDSEMFIVMEFIEGEELRKLLIDNGQLSIDNYLSYAIQIAEGLKAAHAKGITHRDIKSSNIMITESGQVKIMDFGLAKIGGGVHLTHSGTTLGTAADMSPEQARGTPVDHRTDIWSFGVVLYEMLAGRLPFRGEYEQAMMYSIVNEEPDPVSEVRADVPPELEALIHKALEKDVDHRYQRVAEMLLDLKRIQKTYESSSLTLTSARRGFRTGSVPTKKLRFLIGKRIRPKNFAVAALIVLGILMGLLLIDRVQRKQVVPSVAKHRQITFTGNAHYPAISPDGQFIAYVEAEKKLLLQDLSGGQLLELYQATEISAPQWTPDGSEILFGAIEGDSSRALLIPRLGGRPRSARRGYMSPDGVLIASIGTGGKKIVLTNNLTGEQKEIPVSGFEWLTEIDWSPKGELILILTQDKGKYAIWSVTLDSGQQRKIYEIEKELLYPRWSPPGDAIYFFLRQDNTTDLMKLPVSAKTGEKRAEASTLVSGLQAGDYYTLSANGKRLLYTRFLEYSNLWLVELRDNKVEAKPLMQGTSSYGHPAISPDGKWVAFSMGKFPYTHIYKMPIAGGTPEQLTLGEALHATAVWSPDGKRLAFGSFKGNEAKVWTMDANGDNLRQFTRTRLSADAPEIAWAPHNKIIYQTAGNRNLAILDPETEEEKLLIQADSVGWIFFPKYSPDGKKVVAWWNRWAHGSVFGPKDQRGPFIPGLWVISLVDESQVRVSEEAVIPAGWSPDGNWIYGFYGRIPKETLVRLPVSGGEPEIIFTLSEEIIGASVSPDGWKFVCTVPQTQSDVWLLENFDPDIK
ncbi:MAG: protein kinase [candidate division KSB1 bacterium]|nr:protein kinase [candidate division KSB1 bacterium]